MQRLITLCNRIRSVGKVQDRNRLLSKECLCPENILAQNVLRRKGISPSSPGLIRVSPANISMNESLERAARVYGLDTEVWQRLWIRAVTGISPTLTTDELELIDKIHLLASQLRQYKIEIV